jgi:hypothetical protein
MEEPGEPQSRQSAKRFSSRWNCDSPTPLAAGECAPQSKQVQYRGPPELVQHFRL